MSDLFDRSDRQPDIEATYDYHDAKGQLAYQVVRLRGKKFRQRRPDGSGGWTWNVKGVSPLLYRLPLLRESAKSGDVIYVVEGEKDADTLIARGLVATCNSGGAGKWRSSHAKMLIDRQVVVVADRDAPGYRHAVMVVESLQRIAQSVRVVEAREGKDVTDHLASGLSIDDLVPIDPAAKLAELTASVSETGGGTPPSRPEIRVSSDLSDMVDRSLDALACASNLFQRGGRLVHVVEESGRPSGILRPTGAPRIVLVPLAHLRELLAAHVRWTKEVSAGFGGSQIIDVLPPDAVVKALDARGEWPGIRALEGIVATPVLRPDGTVLSEPGYDSTSGLLYAPVGAAPTIPTNPTRDDARSAVAELLDVVQDFPLAEAVHRAAWLASVLTPPARFAFAGPAPLFLYDANTPGSGKGLLASVTGLIVSGRTMTIASLPRNDEEMEKRITALALAGDALVLLDNIAGTLGCASLDAALTAPEAWKGRLLGKSEMTAALPLTMTWYGTGNNVVLGADTPDRIVHVRLDSRVERPRERPETDFAHPRLVEWVKQERVRLIAAALTILRAFVVAGRPRQQVRSWGSFEGWSDVVREALVWAGQPDPADARDELLLHSDLEANAWRALIGALHELDASGHGLTAAEILDRVGGDPQALTDVSRRLRDAIQELIPTTGGGLPGPRSVGNKLRRAKGRIYDGLALDARPGRAGLAWTGVGVTASGARVCGSSGSSGSGSPSPMRAPARTHATSFEGAAVEPPDSLDPHDTSIASDWRRP